MGVNRPTHTHITMTYIEVDTSGGEAATLWGANSCRSLAVALDTGACASTCLLVCYSGRLLFLVCVIHAFESRLQHVPIFLEELYTMRGCLR